MPTVTTTNRRGEPLNAPPDGGPVGIEFAPLVTPYTVPGDPVATRVIQRLLSKQPDPSDGEAEIRWGAPDNFEVRAPEWPIVTINWDDADDEEDSELERPTPALSTTRRSSGRQNFWSRLDGASTDTSRSRSS